MKNVVPVNVIRTICRELDVDPREVSRIVIEPSAITVEKHIPVVNDPQPQQEVLFDNPYGVSV